MADIFISNVREDDLFAVLLSRALREVGWTVELNRPGASPSEMLEEVQKAKSVVVLWSKASINSDWMLKEARAAAARNVLFPVVIDDVEAPEVRGSIRTKVAALGEWTLKELAKFSGSLVITSQAPGPSGPAEVAAELAQLHDPVRLKPPSELEDEQALTETQGFIDLSIKLRIHFRIGRAGRVVGLTLVAAALVVLIGVGRSQGWWLRGGGPHSSEAATNAQGRSDYFGERRKGADRAIVFVHGVFGDATSTWTAANGAYWPSLIRQDHQFDNDDIFVVNYPSPKVVASYSIDELADDVRLAFDTHEVFQSHKQVVFICHSMGGLVVRKFLLRYQKYKFPDQVPMIYFYSTPTTGAEIAKLAVILKSQNPQLPEMKPWTDDSFVGGLASDWAAGGFAIRSYCAYEKKNVFGVRVVTEQSATHSCNQRYDSIIADHMEMVKPTDIGDKPFLVFKSAYNETFVAADAPLLGAPGRAAANDHCDGADWQLSQKVIRQVVAQASEPPRQFSGKIVNFGPNSIEVLIKQSLAKPGEGPYSGFGFVSVPAGNSTLVRDVLEVQVALEGFRTRSEFTIEKACGTFTKSQ